MGVSSASKSLDWFLNQTGAQNLASELEREIYLFLLISAMIPAVYTGTRFLTESKN